MGGERYKPMKEGKEGCWALKQRGRWGIPFVMEWTSSQRHFITAFNGHISLLTDRRTKWEIYDRMGDLSGTFTSAQACAAAPNRTGLRRSLSPPVQDDVSALWSGPSLEWEHMSKPAKSASSAEASCLAGELSRLRCLAPFPPLSPALNGPTMALLLSSPSVSISRALKLQLPN